MTSPVIMLEEQSGDVHSSQVAYKLTVHNTAVDPILILGLKAHVPQGAQLLEISDNESANCFSKRAELIEGLNDLLNDFLWLELEAFREGYIAAQVKTGGREN